MDLPGYDAVHPLLRSGAFAVYRGFRTIDRRPVLLKTTVRRPPRAADLETIEREHRLLTSVGGAGVPAVLDLVRTPELAFLALDDQGLLPLRSVLSQGAMPLTSFFRLALNLCRVLAPLHDRGVIHGAINPAGIFTSATFDRVQLVDFAAAGHAASETMGPAVALTGEAAAYISPEQTGRINRRIDHRTDLYSLGATFYELLTGSPPFASADTLELIHSQIARIPRRPSEVEPRVPEPLSQIVLRLLAKEASDRYQTVSGLARDLERCERDWLSGRAIAPFELGLHDVSDRFLIPQKLYGRARELADLTAAFERTCDGGTRLVLVAGPAGAGKTALIGELYRPIVRQRGKFVTGKSDPIVRDVPLGAFVRAFRSLVWQLLTESEDRLSASRERVSAALGANAAVLAEVIPEIEFIIGRQPAPPSVDPAEAQNRFQLMFQNFVAAIADRDHPLVVFLDDLQWADSATLQLLHALLTSPDVRHALFVGAYRDSEGAGHPLQAAVSRLEAAGAAVERIALGPLPAEDVARFLADTLHADPQETRPLADLVLRRTDGTPFFVIQYLRTLHQNGLFVFDSAARRWRFALDAIAAADTTHDVVDLMTARIRRLSDAGQEVVMLAACLGSPFDVATVEAASGLAAPTVAEALSEAIDAGLVHRTLTHHELDDVRPSEATACAFVHDRVQQAAYGLIPEEDRKRRHLEIGRLLVSRAEDPAPDDRLFAIVNHLNIGAEYVTDPETRRIVARTNLRAGRKAKQSTAFDTAATYLDTGISVLGAQDWQGDYDLLFALHLEAAECHYLGGRFETAERRFEELLEHAATALDAAQVHSLRVVLCENLSRYDEAVASGRMGLALLGEHLPADRTDIQHALDLELQAIEGLLDGRPIARLSELPEVQDPAVRMVLRILTSLWAPAYLSGNQVLTRLVSARMVRLSLEHGNTEDSAYGYVTHAITVGPVLRDYETAYEWGVLALRVNERFGAVRRRAKIHQQFQAHVNLWRQPLETCIPHAREARRSGLDAGDFTYAGYGAVTESWAAFFTSASLDRFVRDHTPALALLDKIQMRDFFNALRIMLNWALALQGRTETPTSLSNEHFDEDRFAAAYEKTAPVFLGFLEAARTHLLVLHEAFVPALTSAARGRAVALEGTIWPVLLDFWGGLAITGAWADLTAQQRADYTMQLATARATLSELADNCPANFRCYALLLAAESARIDGRAADAASLCEDAIGFAGEIGSTQQHALACELAARARLAAGETFAASAHLGEAWRSYRSWGADAKLAQLERRYGALLERPASSAGADADRPAAPAEDVETPAASLDMATVLKLSRVIAGEIHLDRLVERLIRITLENAGAERGLFLLERDGQLVLEAEARADSTEVLLHGSVPLEAAQVPLTVVRYVWRTGQPLVVGDALADERFAQDPCLVAARVSSVLCVPVSQQGRLRGLLYLENRLTSHAFTPERTEMVRILAAQAAISLENARLYEEMRAEVERRTAAEHRLREALAEVEALKNRLEAENVYLQEEIHTEHNFNEVVGNSPALLDALRRIELVAPTDSSVLILGETGSGKELFARAVHSRSARRARPLVKVNCGAIAPGLVESELFGHVKGAFTGAIDRRVGRFELAHGGTIFLDEVGELPLDAQVKLLRVLQEQEFEPVGSSRTVRVDVRVIAATNRDLDRAVADGRFRADLLYRLNVFPVAVPPLRARPGDIPLLVGFFVSGLARKLGKPLKGFSTRSMERLMQYSWPGNVRELQNVVERSAILAQGPVLEVESGFAADSARIPAAPVSRERSTLDEIQRAHILSVLKSTGGVVEGARGAATILGLHPNTLRSRMKKLGIHTGAGG